MKIQEEPLLIDNGKLGHLSAVLHRAKSKKIVVMAHGFTGSKIENGRLFVQAARALAEAGINALRFDFMGSGDSSGDFNQMSPNSEIADLQQVVATCLDQGFKRLGILGLSFGGGVSICATQQLPEEMVDCLVTWSSVPSFCWWRSKPTPDFPVSKTNPLGLGPQFFKDRPEVDVPEAYAQIVQPKLQIQGDNDIPEFRERFAKFFPEGPGVKKHVVVPGADHVFTNWQHRKKVIALTVKWFQQYL